MAGDGYSPAVEACALQFLRQDLRPTLMLDLSRQDNVTGDCVILFLNDAFRDAEELSLRTVRRFLAPSQPASKHLGRWVVTVTKIDNVTGDIRVVTASSSQLPPSACTPPELDEHGYPIETPCAAEADEGRAGEALPARVGGLPGIEEESGDGDESRLPFRRPRVRLGHFPRTFSDSDFHGKFRPVPLVFPADDRKGRYTSTLSPPDTPQTSDFNTLAPTNYHPAGAEPACCKSSTTTWKFPNHIRYNQAKSRPFMDWSVEPKDPLEDTPHFKNLRAVDWASTSAGAPETWSTSLKAVANAIMGTPYPAVLYLGPKYCMIYNSEWQKIAQDKDPHILGRTFIEGWPELEGYLMPIIDAAYHEGRVTYKKSELLFFHQRGEYEERYFEYSLAPVIGEDGAPVGVLETAFEHTQSVVTQRRLQSLRRIANSLGSIRNLETVDLWSLLLAAFDESQIDSPFLILYRTTSEIDDTVQQLQGCAGVSAGGTYAPHIAVLAQSPMARRNTLSDPMDPYTDRGIFVNEMRLAKETNSVVVKKLPQPRHVAQWEVRQRGYNDPITAAAVIPIQAPERSAHGFLIIGLNQRRPYDEDYRVWLEFVRKELATTAARSQLSKEEISRVVNEEKEKAARKQAIHLQEQLTKRTQDLRHSELLFTRTAETIPVGLVLMSSQGEVYFANDAYRELMGMLHESLSEITHMWPQCIYSEDRSNVVERFNTTIRTGTSLHMELRVGNESGANGWRYWLAASMIPQRNEGAPDVIGFMIALVDITSIKLNEEYQRQLSTQALERRRQQENFIDMFSHELRNPFSATMQCADGMLSALMAHLESAERLDIEDLIDSAQTILICVQHQMRIVDDVLTLSKLDSMLLSVIPADYRIHESVRQITKIFAGELTVKGIQSSFVVEDSYRELGVDWVRVDNSRFSQILINLMTNAIKFTSLQTKKREITIRLGACLERPKKHGSVTYQENCDGEDPQGLQSPDTTSSEWGTGEVVFIQVAVQDTGIGISQEWQSKLFKRFEQVPKTHVTYGGSGLGLFICRKLCRLQAGGIGVDSADGRGSTFAFFIKSRRSVSHDPHARRAENSPLPGSLSEKPPSHEARTMAHMRAPTPVLLQAGHRGSIIPASPPQSPTSGPAGAGTFETTTTPTTTTTTTTPTTPTTPTSASAPAMPLPPPPPSYRVLIVEDNLINQEVLRRQLKKEGCVTYVASDGQQAIDFICNETWFSQPLRSIRSDPGSSSSSSSFSSSSSSSHDPSSAAAAAAREKELDIVLMDMEMPIMDGNTATREIRRMQASGAIAGHVPIMGISANARPEQVRRMTEAGMDDAISKPFRIKELLARFGDLLKRLDTAGKVGERMALESVRAEADRRRHTT